MNKITFKNICDYTLQEVYDYIVNHMRKQGVQAQSKNLTICSYKTTVDNIELKCAVGCLIPDEDYTPEMEGCGSYEMLGKFYPDVKCVGVLGLLASMQAVHDSDTWEDGFKNVAEHYGLKYNE